MGREPETLTNPAFVRERLQCHDGRMIMDVGRSIGSHAKLDFVKNISFMF